MVFVSEWKIDIVNFLLSSPGEKNVSCQPISCKAFSLIVDNQVTSDNLSLGFYLEHAGSFLKERTAMVNISIWKCSIAPSIAETQHQLLFFLGNMQTLREVVSILIRKIITNWRLESHLLFWC